MAKTKTDKALLITAIVLTVIALVGLAFSAAMSQAVNDLLHPSENSETTESETDAGEQAGRAIASVFAAIIFLPVWFLVEIITLALDIPSLVMSSTLCGRLAHDRKLAKQDEQNGPEETPAPKRGKGMLIASVVLIVLNVAVIATVVLMTLTVLM